MPATRLSGRVVARLAQAEVSEPNPHYRDDFRIARLTVAYAASGEAVLCSPHVLASYMVLGLHPDRVWPAIVARREALGLHDKVLEVPPVPKKPAESVKLWLEKTNAARVSGPRGGKALVLCDQTISVPMAAPSIAASYPNSDPAGSGKERPFFKREELQEFFETCPSDLVSHPELRTVHGMWIAAGKPFGTEIQFFKAMRHYAEGAPNGGYRSESTVRSNIRRAEDSGVIEVAYRDPRGNCHHIWIRERCQGDRGLYRRVTTHRLSIPLLLTWRHRRGQDSARVQPIRKPAQTETPSPLPQKSSAPDHHRGTERGESRASQRQRALRAGVLADMSKLMSDGTGREDALKKVCRTWGITAEQAQTILRECLFEPPQKASASAQEKCGRCGTHLAQNFGPGPRLVCPKCAVNSS